MAPETHRPKGAKPFFVYLVMEAAPSWGINRLALSGARNALSQGGHPLFHSFYHGGRPLVGHKQVFWTVQEIRGCMPLRYQEYLLGKHQ